MSNEKGGRSLPCHSTGNRNLSPTAPCAAVGFSDWLPVDARTGPQIPPTLWTTYCPSKQPRPVEEPQTAADDPFWKMKLGDPAVSAADERSESLGFSTAPNLTRHGLEGISPKARHEVRKSCTVLERFGACIAFWTVTLPDEALRQIRDGDKWPVFQHRVQRELRRRLIRAGLPGELVGVVELHPKRSAAAGEPMPHIHVAFRARKTRWHHWALDRWELDSIIQSACSAAGGGRIDARAAGNVQPVRKSVKRYLSKYLTKQSSSFKVSGVGDRLVPRQWWFRSGECLRLVLSETFSAPWELIAFVHGSAQVLEELGLIRWQQLVHLPPDAPPCFAVDWIGPDQLAAVLALWQEQEWDLTWRQTTDPFHVRPRSCDHPVSNQHL